MQLPPSFLDELRARLPLSEVIGRRIPVTRAGREFKACCPFHNEKTPSFTINDTKGFFHCFGCGAHGDIIGFVIQYDRISFPEAIELLAQQAGMEVPRLSRDEVEKAKEQKTLHQLIEAACAFFEAQLQTSKGRAALEYLQGRGLSAEAMARFRLGYAPSEGGALITHLKKQGYELPQMMEVGLVRHNEERGDHYSFFRDRVMFPVADRRGRVVAFGGRIMSGDGPKYINSPDHPLFHKGKLLYSLARAREAAPRGAPAVVVEGYMDVISLIEAGFGAAVAPLGTALTEDQIEELWKLGGTGGDPILCFDGDGAGQRAAARAVERVIPLLGPGRTVRIAFLPEGQDPDDLIRSKGGPKAMQQVLDQAIPLIDMLWKLETEGRQITTPEAQAGVKQALEERINRIADKTVQSYYQSEIRQRLYDNFGGGKVKFAGRQGGKSGQKYDGKFGSRGGANALNDSIIRRLPPDPATRRQQLAIVGILRQPALYEVLGEQLIEVGAAGPLDKVWQAVVITLETSPDLDSAALQSHICAQGFAEEISLLLEQPFSSCRWARVGASAQEVERGLYGLIAEGRIIQLQAELKAAQHSLASDMSDATHARLSALRRELLEAQAAVLPGDEETA